MALLADLAALLALPLTPDMKLFVTLTVRRVTQGKSIMSPAGWPEKILCYIFVIELVTQNSH